MSLKVKAKEKLQKIGTYAGEYRYVMMPEIYSTLTQDKVIREAALRSGVSQGVSPVLIPAPSKTPNRRTVTKTRTVLVTKTKTAVTLVAIPAVARIPVVAIPAALTTAATIPNSAMVTNGAARAVTSDGAASGEQSLL